MNHKEKAKELIEKFVPFVKDYDEQNQLYNLKQCALIAADEIIEAIYDLPNSIDDWQEVKEEIEKL